MLLRESELREMAELGAGAGIEVSLFVGPARGLRHRRPCAHRGRLGARRASCAGSAASPTRPRTSPAPRVRHPQLPDRRSRTARPRHRDAASRRAADGDRLEDLGDDGAVEPARPARARAARRDDRERPVRRHRRRSCASCAPRRSLPIDLYVESPDALGGVVRGNELGDLVTAGAPLYAKFGLRNARMIYPVGRAPRRRGMCDRTGEGASSGGRARVARPPRARARPVGARRGRARCAAVPKSDEVRA